MPNIMRAPRLAQLTDTDLERAIDVCYRSLVAARSHPSKAAAWRVMCRLIGQRTQQGIDKLEAQRGLVRPS